MQNAFRARARVGEDGTLTLTNLPFPPGERVEVTIMRIEPGDSPQPDGDPPQPMDPVEEHDWDVLK